MAASRGEDGLDGARGQPLTFKVVLLGEGAVGKTSLVLRYVENKFNDKHLSTLQASYLEKKLNIAGRRVTLSIWDTAGQERFHALGPIYYRESNGALLVYDITDEDSFQKVKTWVKELRKMLGNEICLCIVGNKIDLEKDRHVTVEEAERLYNILYLTLPILESCVIHYAESVGATHCHTSAKQNKGLDELFLELCKRMIEKADEESSSRSSGSRGAGSKRSVVTIVDDTPTQQRRGGCCGGGGES